MTTQNYHTIKNAGVLVPATSADLGTVGNPYGNIYLAGNVTLGNNAATITASNAIALSVTSLTYANGQSAANPAGGESMKINGTGFQNGLGIYINGTLLNISLTITSTQITFTTPALAAGNYTISVVNGSGASASYLFGITYSNFPTWTTTSGSLGSFHEGNSISTTLVATDANTTISYRIDSGSLPSGITLAGNGLVSGTLANVSANTTYNFTVGAVDGQSQDTPRNFSIAVVADSITWSSPSTGTNYTEYTGTAISNIGLSASSAFGSSITYSATGLPTGLSISGSNITGTPTTSGNSTAIITATTATKQANISLNFAVHTNVSQTFNYTGSIQSLALPSSIVGNTITVTAVGAAGGWSTNNQRGGAGGNATATLTVTPSSTVYIVVGTGANGAYSGVSGTYGGGGSAPCQFSGSQGGAGGGYSGVFTNSTPSIASALIVAGGGGGATNFGGCNSGGAGGNSGSGSGSDGSSSSYQGRHEGGYGASVTGGGGGGTGADTGTAGGGSALQGGNSTGVNKGGACAWSGGGGGGGGYYGGGGGASGGGSRGAGAGGSTWAANTITWGTANQNLRGSVTISYTT